MPDQPDPRQPPTASEPPVAAHRGNRGPLGERMEVTDLVSPLASDAAPPRGWRALVRNLTLFTAGMYTGVKCYGIPRRHPGAEGDRDQGPI